MKNTILTVLGITALVACSPVKANEFTGTHVALTAGLDDLRSVPDTTDVTYGVTAGADFSLGENAIVGGAVNVDNVFDRRDLGASIRLGYILTDNLLAYGRVGYSNYQDVFSRELDGLQLGGGLEFNINDYTFTRVEYKYTDFESGVGKHQGLVGLGVRF